MTAPTRTPPLPAGPALTIFALGLAAAAVAGCHRGSAAGFSGDHPLAVSSRLDCPDKEGELRRVDAAPDGRSCRYTGPGGQEVTLAYLALDGRTPQEALQPTEADLRALVPAAASPEPGSLRPAAEDGADADKAAKADADEDEDDDRDDRSDDHGRDRVRASADAGDGPTVPAAPKPPEPPQIDRSWTASTHGGDGDHERVRIDLPFLHVHADGQGGAQVHAFGVDVDARHGGADVQIPGGGHINAGRGGAEMRFGSVGRHRADLIYIVASKAAGPGGYRSAAYVAKGPAQGPLVLAVTRARHEDEDHDRGVYAEDLREVKRLVNLNVRGDRGSGFNFDVD